MIAILAYIISDASNTSKMSSLGDLGQLLYDLEALSDSTRILSRQARSSSVSQAQKDLNYKNFQSLLTGIQNIKNNLLDDFDHWSYCESSKIIHEKLIPLWIFNGEKPYIEYNNLYDTLSKFIYSGSKTLDNLYEDDGFSPEMKFLMLNGLSYVFEYINMTTDGIVDCEINRIKLAGKYINTFIMMGFSIIGLLVLSLCLFIILASKSYDQFWNFMLNNIQSSLSNLKACSIDRLMIIHRNEYTREENQGFIASRHHPRKIKSKIYLSYISRIFIFFAIAGSYYFLVYFHLYPNCQTLMIDRPLLLNNFSLFRTLLSRLDIFARDMRSPVFITEFQDFYDFPNSQIMADNTFEILKSKRKEIKKENFSVLMSQELLNRIYKSNNSTEEVLEYGTDASIDDIIDEIYSLFYKNLINTDELSQYFEKLQNIQNEILKEFFLADRDSKNIINSELDAIIESTIFYSLTVCLLFFIYYLPYFNSQIKQLSRFAILPNILEINAEPT
ncbi:unnamed protein product [Blepharisma stoltei]|uniref:Uncharacterized protein n=1 Tax=Blepharisma stoltei TaxID=1481888 RepID=A0AAU9IYD0_9CILI|nr:unnamed protein product [Blepharisma stoltei]